MIYGRLTAELEDRWAAGLAEKVQRCRNGLTCSAAPPRRRFVVLTKEAKRTKTGAGALRDRWLRAALACTSHLDLQQWLRVVMQLEPPVFTDR